jgi:hypothetical protein
MPANLRGCSSPLAASAGSLVGDLLLVGVAAASATEHDLAVSVLSAHCLHVFSHRVPSFGRVLSRTWIARVSLQPVPPSSTDRDRRRLSEAIISSLSSSVCAAMRVMVVTGMVVVNKVYENG